ncbi:hypothetical protein [Egbenema bharatensis]|uniref:hypothetical protein n=1 Tax=Egbenema bharatensis TaxID=3463334 RepID=UPI003A853D43
MMRNWLKHLPERIRSLLASGMGLGGLLLASPPAVAVEDTAVLLLLEPIDMPQVIRYWQGEVPTDGSVITEGTISQTNLTPPSLWWTQEQFGDNLLNFWVAYPGVNGELRRVDLIINRQVWLRSTYLDRYAFLNHFGTAASDFGYQTRIYDWQGDLLGVYVCQFEPAQSPLPPATPPIASDCRVFLDTFGLGIFASPIPNGAPEPIPPGIGQ